MNTLETFSLKGKTALVTGCRRGMGMAMATGLAEAGADIIGVSATQGGDGEAVGKKVRELGRTFRGYACDFANRRALYAFIEQAKREAPKIDILINNAGNILRKP